MQHHSNLTSPKVSICLPTYNRAEYLGSAIRSVLAQTFSDWELIIWNDGSSDKTEDVVLRFKDPRIKYYYEENHGKSYALNQALQVARGKFIAFLDDDDQWFEEKTEIQIGIMERHPEIDVLFANFNNINLVTGEKGIGFTQNARGLRKLVVNNLEIDTYLINDKFPEGVSNSNFLLPSTMLIRKKIIDSVGGFNETLRNSLDIEYFWRIYMQGYSFAYINMVLVNRLKPEGSLSSPNIATYQNNIKCSEACRFYALNNARKDLLKFFDKSEKHAWLGLLRLYAISGDRDKAISAFFRSFQFGFSLRAFYLLFGALLGPKIIRLIKRL